jgi:peptidoglycan/xylan/chitin deacetylase (PgdA/CDA1 family)
MRTLLRAAVAAAASAGTTGRLSVLIYHRVLERPDPLFPDEVDARRFADQMALLSTAFNVIPLSEAVDRLVERRLPPRAVCVTFDDGYRDNCEVALPILARYRVPATFFVASGFLDGGTMWNDVVIETVRRLPGPDVDWSALGLGRFRLATIEDRRHAVLELVGALKYRERTQRAKLVDAIARQSGVELPTDLMMTSKQVATLAGAGMEIGAHTLTHPILAQLDDGAAADEILSNRDRLQQITGKPVTLFAYPNGKPDRDYAARDVRIVRDGGFKAAVSTAWGVATATSDLFELPRFTPWDRSLLRFGGRLALNRRRTQFATAVQLAAPA